jgi:hypothetical protein
MFCCSAAVALLANARASWRRRKPNTAAASGTKAGTVRQPAGASAAKRAPQRIAAERVGLQKNEPSRLCLRWSREHRYGGAVSASSAAFLLARNQCLTSRSGPRVQTALQGLDTIHASRHYPCLEPGYVRAIFPHFRSVACNPTRAFVQRCAAEPGARPADRTRTRTGQSRAAARRSRRSRGAPSGPPEPRSTAPGPTRQDRRPIDPVSARRLSIAHLFAGTQSQIRASESLAIWRSLECMMPHAQGRS